MGRSSSAQGRRVEPVSRQLIRDISLKLLPADIREKHLCSLIKIFAVLMIFMMCLFYFAAIVKHFNLDFERCSINKYIGR